MAIVQDLGSAPATAFRREVEQLSGERVGECYQCAKCTGGCPLAADMGIDPARVMRLVQLGQRDAVLSSEAIWLCASCETCVTRCPQEVDLPKVMDALRALAVRDGYAAGNKGGALLNRLFLGQIRRSGRIHEMGLVALFNTLRGKPLTDATKGPAMFLKRKLHLLPHASPNAAAARRIFERVEEMEGRTP